ncbi:isochorismatase domain-containing protein 1-like isoform X2 [Paramacrobiotus metropolitanus]|uniref:isochorismatase domain-containing protein 1-like isoform X2 n=1 Tax=Paramacrobiotus metropolitanus TaxID=2943436 RepID=UPI0024464291|nr:isochorismatase domain-containing protein 1-like isoform X2 [Paramacrobiotus metropolitanus]
MSRLIRKLVQNQTAFFLCDMQEAFRPNVKYFAEITENCRRLLEGAKILEIPVVVTEQYPKGLKHTVKELDISSAAGVFDKTVFSMVIPETEKLMSTMCDKKLQTVVLFGIEAHVCILHTALDLRAKDYEVHVVADGVSSRSLSDRALAFERLKQAGCIMTSAETVLMELLGSKDHPQFKAVQKLVLDRAPDTGLYQTS